LPSVRFIRFARLAVLVADLSTIAFVTLLFTWQTIVFLRIGSWQPLPLSVAFSAPKQIDGDVYQTASIAGMADGQASNLVEMLLQLPLITVLLVGAAMLTAFYAWLHKIEKAPR
jgi:ABC-type molybdate transport system permease subunit